MTPAWRNSASTATSGDASAAVCDDAARLPACGAAALHRDDRLATRDAPGEPGELARVPERLEVEEDHVGVRVVLPVLQQVVAAHVGLVADRDELRDADPELAGPAHQLDAETARLREERDRAAARARPARTSRSCARPGAVFTMPRQFGPMMRMPLRRAIATRSRSASLPLVADLGEPGRDDHEAVHALLRALFDDARHGVGRNDDDRDVDRVGDVEDARVRRARPRPTPTVGFTGYTGPWKPYASRLRNSSWPIVPGVRLAPMTAIERGASSRAIDAASACARAASTAAIESVVGSIGNRTRTVPSLELAVRVPARVREHVQHPRVVRQRVRGERRDARSTGRRRRGARAAACRGRGPAGRPATVNATSASSSPVRS